MPALLAAEARARDEHRVEDVAVADRGAHDAPAGALDRPREAAVGEDAHDDGALGERLALEAVERDDAEQLVAVDDLASLVDRDAAVRVPVEAEARRRRPLTP